MEKHELVLILTSDPTEEEADRLYGIVDDATLATTAGVPELRFHREAESLEMAMRSAIKDVRKAGFEVKRIELEPDAVSPAG